MADFQPIQTQAHINSAIADLVRQDPVLAPLAQAVGQVPLRLRPAGFEGLARIVISQQVSVASANAIWSRFAACLDPITPQALCALTDVDLIAVGLSRPKVKTLRAVAQSCQDGLDLEALITLPPKQARDQLIAIHGIGPWTADIFLMFCAGHPDIFPVGDIALQNMVRDVLSLRKRPSETHLTALARRWRPHRAVAARLLWAYYGLQKARSVGSPIDAAQSKLPV